MEQSLNTRPPRLYVIVISNISRSQQAIQAGHGVAKFVAAFPHLWGNRTLIYLRVPDEVELLNWFNKLQAKNADVVCYEDPSWKSSTAVAVFGTDEIIEDLKSLSLI
jgi:hypothetical protein